jgi:hypothetical protein
MRHLVGFRKIISFKIGIKKNGTYSSQMSPDFAWTCKSNTTNERYAQCNILGRQPYGGGSVMVWGGVCSTARIDLHVFPRGTTNSTVYVIDILEKYVVPFAPFIGDNFIFQHDNVSEYLDEVDIASMQWSARSQEINPIENMLDVTGRRVRALQLPPATLGELGEAIIVIWDSQDQADVLSTINLMGRRCEAIIDARGGNTRY